MMDPRGTVGRIYKHTCDEFKRGIREIFLPFQGDFSKMYRMYREIPDSFQGDFEFLFKKWYFLEEFSPILRLISWSLPDDEGGITCMYKEDHYTLLLTKYESSGPCGFGEEDFFMFFPL